MSPTSKYLLLISLVIAISHQDLVNAREAETSGNSLDEPSDERRTRPSGRTFQTTIKDCIQTCRRLLFRGDRDLNYCIEGCRIRIYRKIYECVYDQCNDRGNGIPGKYSREQYHQCVYLCKVKPKIKQKPSTTPSPSTTSTDSPPKEHPSDQVIGLSMKDYAKPNFIPLEYHYYNDNAKKTQNQEKH